MPSYGTQGATAAMASSRPRRQCVERRMAVPSAVHYLGYVEDEETPEMIMKKAGVHRSNALCHAACVMLLVPRLTHCSSVHCSPVQCSLRLWNRLWNQPNRGSRAATRSLTIKRLWLGAAKSMATCSHQQRMAYLMMPCCSRSFATPASSLHAQPRRMPRWGEHCMAM